MKLWKRFFCIGLSLFLSFSSSIVITAEETVAGKDNQKTERFFRYIACQLGALNQGDLQQSFANQETWDKYFEQNPESKLKDLQNAIDNIDPYTTNDDGTITFKDDYLAEMKNYIQWCMQTYAPYYVIKGTGDVKAMTDASLYSSVPAYNNVISAMQADSSNDRFILSDSSGNFFSSSFSPLFYVFNDSCREYNLYDSQCQRLSDFVSREYPPQGIDISYLDDTATYCYGTSGNKWSPLDHTSGWGIKFRIVSFGYFTNLNGIKSYSDLYVFRSKEALMDYLCNGASIYYGDVYNGDITNINKTINYNTYINTDWSAVNNATYQQIIDAIKDLGDNPSEKDIKKIVNSTVDDLQNTIKNATGDVTQALNSNENVMNNKLSQANIYLKQILDVGKNMSATLSNLESICRSGFNDTIPANYNNLATRIEKFNESMCANNGAITTELKTSCQICNEIKALLAEKGGMSSGEIDLSKIEDLCSSIDASAYDTVAIDGSILQAILGDAADHYTKGLDGVIEVNGDCLISLLTDVRDDISSSRGLLADIKQAINGIRLTYDPNIVDNITVNDIKTADDGDSLWKKLGNIFQPLADTAQDKFPFSIPWDMMAVMNTVKASPETPAFTFNLDVDRFNIHEEIILDMDKFGKVSKISRGFLTLSFIWALMCITNKLIKGNVL